MKLLNSLNRSDKFIEEEADQTTGHVFSSSKELYLSSDTINFEGVMRSERWAFEGPTPLIHFLSLSFILFYEVVGKY